MKILVMGATGGSGRAAVEQALAQGHEVTAFSRRASRMGIDAPGFRAVDGDAMSVADVERAVAGQDVVIVTLGISENPLRVRLFGPARTPIDVRSQGTRNVMAAMKTHNVGRLVVQTSYGVGETRPLLGWMDRLFFALLLKPQIADTEVQNREVQESGLDWVLIQPVHLTDGEETDMPFHSTLGETGAMKISRQSVGRFLVHAATNGEFSGKTVSLSGQLASVPARHPSAHVSSSSASAQP